MSTLPAAFIGHGNPMNALETNRFTDAWAALGRAVGTPRAVLAISAHWYIAATAVTAMARPRTIHDFFGFPQALFEFEYPAPGLPALAEEVATAAAPDWVGADHDSWGLDHGTWAVLTHMFPDANVPVVQLSVNAAQPLEYHVGLGRKLAPLREQGIFIVASGNVVHNLRRMDFSLEGRGYDWAERFDAAVTAAMTSDPSSLASLAGHPDYALAVPTPDHYLPAAYLAGLAEVAGEPCAVLAEGCELGGISMTSFSVGLSG